MHIYMPEDMSFEFVIMIKQHMTLENYIYINFLRLISANTARLMFLK